VPFLEEPLPEGRELLAVEAIRDEMRLLSEAPVLLLGITGPVASAVFVEELPESSETVYSHAAEVLQDREIEDLESARALVQELRLWAKEEGIKTRELLHPLRLALTGRNRGPEMAYLFAVLGAREARSRINRAREARLRA
jgi:glutamyl/glutaminyl-tRNA synthetase